MTKCVALGMSLDVRGWKLEVRREKDLPMAKVNVYVTLKPALLDAQGKVVQGALENLGFGNVESVRMGKFIEIEFADGNGDLEKGVEEMCKKLLANPNTENYRFEVVK